MRERQRLIPKKDRVLQETSSVIITVTLRDKRVFRDMLLPVIELKARSPIGGAEQSLNGTGQVDKQIAHEEKPEKTSD